jgi:hypothetical protein
MSDIWKRHVELQRQQQREKSEILEPIIAKYEPLFEALREECGQIGHQFIHSHFNVGGDQVYRCSQCGKTSRLDSIKELGQK